MQQPVGLEPLVHEPLVDRVYQRLREAILDGSIAPGEALIERQLAERLRVSRAPIRDALRALKHEGLLSARGRKGLLVNTLTAKDAWEVYTVRAALESLAAKLACERLTPSALSDLRELVDAMDRASTKGDVDALSGLDVRFHERLCRVAGHRRLLVAWSGMAAQIRLLSLQVVDTLYADLHDVARRHRLLLETLEKRDADLLERHIREHIESVAARVTRQLADMEEPGVLSRRDAVG